MDPLSAFDALTGTYGSFVEGFSEFRSDAISEWVADRARQGRLFWREPYLSVRRRYKEGAPLNEIDGLHPRALELLQARLGDRRPYHHQSEAMSRSLAGRNVIVATGTGSGKSFSFYVPVVSTAMEAADAGHDGVKAVLVYPMNALANAQYEELVGLLIGSGLKVCNYTGDLMPNKEKALEDFAARFGRKEPLDCEVIDRKTLRDHGTDVLITNYVMLELALTRREDRQLFPLGQMQGLRMLVLDEVHTYSGRQGADVACLIRRFKQHAGVERLRCMATSATVDSSSVEEGGEAIAAFASALFGEPFAADDVLTDSFAEPSFSEGHERLAWLERTLAEKIVPRDELRELYQSEFGEELGPVLAQEIAAGRLAPRVHAFFSQGRSVTLCLRSAATDEPHMSERSERTCSRCAADGVDDVPAFPAVFCAACGQEYLVADAVDTDGGARLVPREFEATETDGDAVYVLPEALGEEHAAVPDEYVKKDGTARKGKEGGVPIEHVVCGRCGTLGGACEHADEQRPVALIPKPFLFCPSCGVQHGAGREFNKFSQVGLVGRATATDVLVSGLLDEQHDDADVQPRVMAFCDNRQDSSFQASHLNAFHRRIHMRRALYAGLAGAGAPLGVSDSAWKALEAMEAAKAIPAYAPEGTARYGSGASDARARYASYLGFGALLESSGYARLVQPTLEDAGLMRVRYDGLHEVAADGGLFVATAGARRPAV